MNESTPQDIQRVLDVQKKAFITEGSPSFAQREDWLRRAISLLVDNADELVEALNTDFGNRSRTQSYMTDVMSSINPLKHAIKNMRRWSRPEKRKAELPMNLLGSRAEVRYQPLGTVGVISPWNFPVNLTFTPLAGIFAAGNRVMIKPSEYTPVTSEVMSRLFGSVYDESELACFPGGPEVGAAFSGMHFDHLLFTGATSIARHVMRAASENLVPVTLELGGKSPVIIGESADIELAARRIMFGKTLNAGQICLAPDYVMLPEERVGDFVSAATEAVGEMYPEIKHNQEYTSVINERHYERLQGYLTDAKERGAELVEINPANEDFSQQDAYRMPPTLVLNPTDEMAVMQEEIFGPVLPVKSFGDVGESIDYINAHPRPLGLYYFGNNTRERDQVLGSTSSGGVTVNDVVWHVGQEDLPFGGIGPSGMGSYHGHDGFKTFSHAKAVLHQSKIDVIMKKLRPPYSDSDKAMIQSQIKA